MLASKIVEEHDESDGHNLDMEGKDRVNHQNRKLESIKMKIPSFKDHESAKTF